MKERVACDHRKRLEVDRVTDVHLYSAGREIASTAYEESLLDARCQAQKQ